LVKPGGPNSGLITGIPIRKFDRTGKDWYAEKKRKQNLSKYKEEDCFTYAKVLVLSFFFIVFDTLRRT
jgi:hypothetical protein